MVVQFLTKYPTIEEQKNEEAVTLIHCFAKGLQVASLATPPLYLLLALFRKQPRYMRLLKFSNLVFPPLMTGMGYYKLQAEPDKNKSRAWRLQRNFNQYYLEDWTMLGLGAGIILGLALPRLGIINMPVLMSSLGTYYGYGMLYGTQYGVLPKEAFEATNFS